ncbi:MAG: 5-formyltetrahydrofolate cyclo-ligase, partial [Thermodesulfobacteriota bacterium]
LSAALREGKEVFFPKVANGRRGLDFIKVESEDDFAAGIYDIAEPKGGVVLERPSLFHLMVVPGVAFDVKGNRLGYGKGYYDMTLKGAECCIVALAFNFQVVDYIGSEPHDVGVHKIVTEDRILDVAC